MCGIFGYTGQRQAQDLVLQGLKHLEYRGYDSSGIAVQNGGSSISIEKTHGKIRNLEELLKTHPIKGTTAIGHTRWATHGMPSRENAHPHADSSSHIAVVHNGIIENFFDLKKTLEGEGVKFRSETDTEVVAHLIGKYYRGNLENAVRRALREIKGTYAIAVLSSAEPDKIVAARWDSPLVLGVGERENYLASDVAALLDHTQRVVYLDNGDVVTITPAGSSINDLNGRPVKRETVKITWNVAQAKKGGYEHYMLKEIFEQPGIVGAILSERLKGQKVRFDELTIKPARLARADKVVIIACGTAYHAGLVAKYFIEELTDLPVWVDTSSEFRYRDPKLDKRTVVITISQSGETADTLAGLREARKKGAATVSVCNVLGSTIARESEGVIYTHAGPEIAVASTKAYTAQLTVLYLLALYFAQLRGTLDAKRTKRLISELLRVPALMQRILDRYKKDRQEWADNAHDFNRRYHEALSKYVESDPQRRKRSPSGFFLYLGRNINYPTALEGALKLKEISYIPAEGYPAGEMKHGPIALIDENPWVICIAPKSRTYDKMISNIQEIRARGGCIIPVVTEGDTEIHRLQPMYLIEIPEIDELFSPLLTIVPLQLLAYSVAREFGEDIDQPRNLAKSVTVE
ncbi:MAG: Glutamine--fructose-6-phosphate aminotransferase [isomerizing] [Candidatus Omnitrophica bacterium]|nr:Glutamine--fructose-6-phosphate aminotransferase [isomerizing] [Candidatus Omnitrophota bacterium]